MKLRELIELIDNWNCKLKLYFKRDNATVTIFNGEIIRNHLFTGLDVMKYCDDKVLKIEVKENELDVELQSY